MTGVSRRWPWEKYVRGALLRNSVNGVIQKDFSGFVKIFNLQNNISQN